MPLLPVDEQPAAVVMVMPKETVVAPVFGLKFEIVPLADVESITPPVIVQLYVAPGPASVTLADALPFAQTCDGKVMPAYGFEFTVTVSGSLAVLVQPRASMTTT